ncbi:hypothetical protein MTR_1g094910 [Medicago truncatula]|uniref:Uncharacterized protein n=1 Tax=Medicago truncatula TaxID=3880 RepID=G7I376_MEDTR|nr:hypothetical protein MTR_1g094910 [Medicago truncatula]
MVLSALTCLGMIRQVFRLNLGIEKLKMRFLSEKCQTPESHQFELAISSRVARLASTQWQTVLLSVLAIFFARYVMS